MAICREPGEERREAQEVLGEHAIHGHALPASPKILAIDSELDRALGAHPLQAARALAEQSGAPQENLTLIDREQTCAHNDPAGADRQVGGIYAKIFSGELVPFLEIIASA
jgi:hypothetical protein